jgi:very-short-patch-repair endonuclease
VLFERQHAIGDYFVDLFFPEFNLVVECDEIGHVDRCPREEALREVFIKGLGYRMIRFNPNSDDFDVSLVMRKIIAIVCPRQG